MELRLLGLHHVTATVDDAQADLDFCLEALGLRLVKKTVNFDNHHVYHFYYGDEHGTPGTIWTTFPYKGHGVPVGTKGAGQVTATSFSVPAGSLDVLAGAAGAPRPRGHRRRPALRRRRRCSVVDPSGLTIELIASARDARSRGLGGEPDAGTAIRGLHSVTMTIALSRRPTHRVHRAPARLPGRRRRRRSRTRLAVNGDAPGHAIDVLARARRAARPERPRHRAPRRDGHRRRARSSWRCARRCWPPASA